MTTQYRAPLDVIIVGAGIGGLSAAIALRDGGHNVRVIEQAPRLGEVGAGIQLAPNATRLLTQWGVADVLRTSAVAARWSNRRRWEDSSLLGAFELGDAVVERFGFPYWHAHRADLHAALVAVAGGPGRSSGGSIEIELGRTAVGIDVERDGRAVVTLADGAQVAGDAVVGADGIHSMVRTVVCGPDNPRFSGDVAYRALIDTDVVRSIPGLEEIYAEPELNVWLGEDRHLVTYFVRGQRQLNVVLAAPGGEWVAESWTARGKKADLLEVLAGWDDRILALADAAPTVNCWALYDREPLEQWVAGRVCLLGDACHAMLPYQAQGAAQALEDAAALAQALAGVEPDGVPEALEGYVAERYARAARVQLASRDNRRQFHMKDGPEQRKRDAELRRAAGDFESYEWLWAPTPGADALPGAV